MTALTGIQQQRQAAMGVYARATTEELDAALERIGRPAGAEDMRPPELGLVMARGRMGGTGAPFNAGEVSVTRAAVRLSSGEVGVAYQLGRDRTKARVAATLDALWQTDKRSEVEAALDPIRARIAEQIQLKERRVAATKVDFFTLVRGED
ncbi:phosphonate C-P lyase system protein PhnG [Terrihabitans soli]|nr:phosphonate C-P lyase system protein PhnG [Terrihabitans soli]